MVNKMIVFHINEEIYQLNFFFNLKSMDIKLDYNRCYEEFVSRGLEKTKKENLKYIGASLSTEKIPLRKYCTEI